MNNKIVIWSAYNNIMWIYMLTSINKSLLNKYYREYLICIKRILSLTNCISKKEVTYVSRWGKPRIRRKRKLWRSKAYNPVLFLLKIILKFRSKNTKRFIKRRRKRFKFIKRISRRYVRKFVRFFKRNRKWRRKKYYWLHKRQREWRKGITHLRRAKYLKKIKNITIPVVYSTFFYYKNKNNLKVPGDFRYRFKFDSKPYKIWKLESIKSYKNVRLLKKYRKINKRTNKNISKRLKYKVYIILKNYKNFIRSFRVSFMWRRISKKRRYKYNTRGRFKKLIFIKRLKKYISKNSYLHWVLFLLNSPLNTIKLRKKYKILLRRTRKPKSLIKNNIRKANIYYKYSTNFINKRPFFARIMASFTTKTSYIINKRKYKFVVKPVLKRKKIYNRIFLPTLSKPKKTKPLLNKKGSYLLKLSSYQTILRARRYFIIKYFNPNIIKKYFTVSSQFYLSKKSFIHYYPNSSLGLPIFKKSFKNNFKTINYLSIKPSYFKSFSLHNVSNYLYFKSLKFTHNLKFYDHQSKRYKHYSFLTKNDFEKFIFNSKRSIVNNKIVYKIINNTLKGVRFSYKINFKNLANHYMNSIKINSFNQFFQHLQHSYPLKLSKVPKWSISQGRISSLPNSYLKNKDVFMNRIKFRRSYQKIWRRVRSDFKYNFNLKFTYQKQLTYYVAKLGRKSQNTLVFKNELTLLRTVLYSQLLPDEYSFNTFFQKKMIFVNYFIPYNSSMYLIPGDVVRLKVNYWYYVYTRWVLNWNVLSQRKLKRLIYRKSLAYKYKLIKQRKTKSHYIPQWIKYFEYDRKDVKPHLEVDYFTLSTAVIYDPYTINFYKPYYYTNMSLSISRIYNWKYIT